MDVCPSRELLVADEREHGRDDVDAPWNFIYKELVACAIVPPRDGGGIVST